MENIRKQLLDNMSLGIQNTEKNSVLIEIYEKCNFVITYIDENNAWFDNSEYDFSHKQLESLKNIEKEIKKQKDKFARIREAYINEVFTGENLV